MTAACRALVFASLLALVAIGPASGQEGIVGVASVIDGDTVEIYGQRIRFHGIDAPESSQLCRSPTGTYGAAAKRPPWRCRTRSAVP